MKIVRSTALLLGILLLLTAEILRVYYIMPFPGSQRSDTVGFAYFLNNHINAIRIFGLALILAPVLYFYRQGRGWQKVLLTIALLFYGLVFYFFNFRFLAEKMFYQPKQKLFAAAGSDSTDKDRLVIGVTLGGEAKAYPIEIIGYHHQVKDTLGGKPILVTYCTVCRTGRVYSPFIKGEYAEFRLVGMDHFNAMLEDGGTKSWWQQATGIAITGPLKGSRLEEVPSAQMTLGDWQAQHPNSLTLRPDPNYQSHYDSLRGYDEGVIDGSLERRDSSSWKFKSWVVGLTLDGKSKAYDWNQLVKERILTDSIGSQHLLLTMGSGDRSFYAYRVADSLHFYYDTAMHRICDANTHSCWSPSGICIDGPMKGVRLESMQAYQEFWHSWKTFHPNTTGGLLTL